MATYKVIQDIEAEDKLLGPLTLRQFSYAGVTVGCLWLCYFVWVHGATFLIAVIAPFALVSAFFAFPWSREQPTEIWALARIRFLLKPRNRVWDQSGMKELVTITVPKKIEHAFSDGLTQTEVRSRLHALAETIDSRGWAIKNASTSPYMSPAFAAVNDTEDRLIDPSSLPQDVATSTDVYEDVFDPSAAKAQQFDSMLTQSAQAHRAQLVATMQQPVQSAQTNEPADYWFLNQPSDKHIPKGNELFGSNVVTPGAATDIAPASDIDEAALTEKLRSQAQDSSLQKSHMPTILPLAEQERRNAEAEAETKAEALAAAQPPAPKMTAPSDAAILGLAHNDDLNIDTIARQAKKAVEANDGEVVISLH